MSKQMVDVVTIEGSPIIFRRKLGQYQLLVCASGRVYSMTTSWEAEILFDFDSLPTEPADIEAVAKSFEGGIEPANSQEH